MKSMHARLTPHAESVMRQEHGRVSKQAIRTTLRDRPATEFRTIATPVQPREGAYFTLKEASRLGYDQVELRFNDDRDVAIITLHPSGAVVVR